MIRNAVIGWMIFAGFLLGSAPGQPAGAQFPGGQDHMGMPGFAGRPPADPAPAAMRHVPMPGPARAAANSSPAPARQSRGAAQSASDRRPNGHMISPVSSPSSSFESRDGLAAAGHLDFRGRDARSLSPHELTRWRSGDWRRERHHGRFGWWWMVGDWWYFYPEAEYPYPDAVSPDAVEEQAPKPSPASLSVPPAPAEADAYWYYCADPAGYYPNVADCPSPWRLVPTVQVLRGKTSL